jgi:hypothetical protein
MLFALVSQPGVSFTHSNLQPNESNQDQPAESDLIICRLQTDLVVVSVQVTDSQGQYISGLRLEQFAVYEDGKKERVAYFSDEQGLEIENLRGNYVVGYYPTNRTPDDDPRRVRIKVHKWKSNGYQVKYSPRWYVPVR